MAGAQNSKSRARRYSRSTRAWRGIYRLLRGTLRARLFVRLAERGSTCDRTGIFRVVLRVSVPPRFNPDIIQTETGTQSQERAMRAVFGLGGILIVLGVIVYIMGGKNGELAHDKAAIDAGHKATEQFSQTAGRDSNGNPVKQSATLEPQSTPARSPACSSPGCSRTARTPNSGASNAAISSPRPARFP